jgi:shikimate kinase
MSASFELLRDRPAGFLLLSGDDDLTFPQIACGFDGVISLGGGAPINPKIENVLASADYPVIFLDVTIAQAAVRIGFNKERPLLLINPRQQWISLMSTRRGIYEKLATQTVSTDSKKPAEAAAQIVNLLEINA